MKYADYLKTISKCPFCFGIEERTIAENKDAILTYAQAPYHKYHLLVVPKKHEDRIKELTWDDHVSIMALLVSGIKALDKLGHDDCTILVRDAEAPGKSVEHLHYHIIPGGKVQDTSLEVEYRKMLTDDEEKVLKEQVQFMLS